MTVFLTVTTWSSNQAIIGLSCDFVYFMNSVSSSLRLALSLWSCAFYILRFNLSTLFFNLFLLRFHLRFLRHFFQLFSQCFTSVMRSLPGLLDQYLNPSVAQINLSTINQIVIPSAYLLSALRLEGAHYIHLLQPRQHPLLFYFSTWMNKSLNQYVTINKSQNIHQCWRYSVTIME